MRERSWRRALVLGGTRSGKSELAESLVAGEPAVRYVATGVRGTTDSEWEQRIEDHRARRPTGWATEEVGRDPWRLPALLGAADPAEVLLVDEIGTWVGGVLSCADPAGPAPTARMVDELGAAVRDCPARLVVVSPEVGLAPVALTPAGRAFVDALGATNIAIAAACDVVVLVVAGLPIAVKGTLDPTPAT
jgi:adenosyl cobinamide kinase/adenosyl cobinamide phosphate guanylyltransferase